MSWLIDFQYKIRDLCASKYILAFVIQCSTFHNEMRLYVVFFGVNISYFLTVRCHNVG